MYTGKGDDNRRWNINLKPMTPTAQSVAPLFTEHSVIPGNQAEGVRLGKECILVSQAPLLKYLCNTGWARWGHGNWQNRDPCPVKMLYFKARKPLGANSHRGRVGRRRPFVPQSCLLRNKYQCGATKLAGLRNQWDFNSNLNLVFPTAQLCGIPAWLSY